MSKDDPLLKCLLLILITIAVVGIRGQLTKTINEEIIYRQESFVYARSCHENIDFRTNLILGLTEFERIGWCENRAGKPTACNEKYGCHAGMGMYQITKKTWNGTLDRMERAEAYLPERCWIKIEGKSSRLSKGHPIFDRECNIEVAEWLYDTDGNEHWGTENTNWGSWKCWNN